MASLIYNSAIDDMVRGLIDFDTDTFKAMLVTSSYVADEDTHEKRDDITNEVSGTGYTAGGIACGVTVTKSLGSNSVTIEFAEVSWPGSVMTARGCIYYNSRGGAANLDELVVYNDFGSNISASATTPTFNVAPTTITLETTPGAIVLPPNPPISVPAGAYLVTPSSGAVIQAETPGGSATEGPLIIPIVYSGPSLAEIPNPVNANYDNYLISATYSGAEMTAACGGATTATIVGMTMSVLEAPPPEHQPFPGYVIGAKNTTNSVSVNNSGEEGGIFTQVYGPGNETFTTGAVKEFLFSSPIVWSGGNFAFVWFWDYIPNGYVTAGYIGMGDGVQYLDIVNSFSLDFVAYFDTAYRPAFKLLYTT